MSKKIKINMSDYPEIGDIETYHKLEGRGKIETLETLISERKKWEKELTQKVIEKTNTIDEFCQVWLTHYNDNLIFDGWDWDDVNKRTLTIHHKRYLPNGKILCGWEYVIIGDSFKN